jgi:DNA-binding CsgD family transcriptional regulator
MYTLSKNDYDDALKLINCCISTLKNGGKTEDILSEMLKSFRADDAVFLSANSNYNGVNLANSYVLCKDRKYLNQYADYFWRYDPLYQMQFCPVSSNPVFKTDDVIPYSQLINLEYYNSFLRPQNLLGELIIRLCSKDSVFGAISLQRFKEHPNFEKKDTQKASLLVPFLINIFETANRFIKINDERILLEQWIESHSEGIILLDSELRPIFYNSKAKLFCQLLNGINEKALYDSTSVEISIPQVIVQDCKNLTRPHEENGPLQSHSNRIINVKHKKRYYIQYFPIISPSRELPVSRFIIFLNELTRYGEYAEEILTKQHKLSEREEIIAQYAAIGLSNKQIAEKLCISPYTVQNHLKSVFEKTGLNNRTQLANLVKYTDSRLS